MQDRDIIDEIKSRLDIVKVISRSVSLTKTGKMYKGAIELNSKSGKSLNVDSSTQVFYDFPSGQGGDVFNWIAFDNKLDIHTDFPAILRIAAEEAGVVIDNGMCGYSQQTHEISTFLTALAEYYHQNLTDETKAFIYDKWGIEYKTIDALRIGLAPTDDSILKTFGDLFDRDIVRSSGAMIKTIDGWKDYYKGRLIFPYWKNGKVVYMIGRALDGITPRAKHEINTDAEGNFLSYRKYKKMLTHSETYPYVAKCVQNKYFYGEDSMRYKEEYVVISEGVTDCITATQLGIPSISPVTTNISDLQKDRLLDIIKRKKKVYVCNDNEENCSGLKGAMKTAEFLQNNGVYVQIIELPKN